MVRHSLRNTLRDANPESRPGSIESDSRNPGFPFIHVVPKTGQGRQERLREAFVQRFNFISATARAPMWQRRQ
jgi:hypothetical protein